MLPGAYVFRMRSLWTANSLTSRNISSAPPARTLMLYHSSVAPTPSQGTASAACAFWHPLRRRPALVLVSAQYPLGFPALCGEGGKAFDPSHFSCEQILPASVAGLLLPREWSYGAARSSFSMVCADLVRSEAGCCATKASSTSIASIFLPSAAKHFLSRNPVPPASSLPIDNAFCACSRPFS